jgi:phosphoglycolate phosphatase
MPRTHDTLVFDLDGTLSDPIVGIGRSINYALEHFGLQPYPLPSLTVHIGPPLDEIFASLTNGPPELIAGLVEKYRERYAEVGYAENELYAGVREALTALREAGVPLGLCTSKRVDFAEKILVLFGLRELFEFVSGGGVGIQKWEQMQVLRNAGQVSDASVMIGDRVFDMIAAHRNGLSAAGVLWGHGSRAELEAERLRYLLQQPDDLMKLAQ